MVMALTPELRQFFGVPADRGVLIAKIEPGSAAARAGIQVGDVLVRVGPRRVTSGSDVIQALAAQPGERIRVAVVRRGQRVRLEATLPSAPRAPVPDPRPL
jgi:serine protease Do